MRAEGLWWSKPPPLLPDVVRMSRPRAPQLPGRTVEVTVRQLLIARARTQLLIGDGTGGMEQVSRVCVIWRGVHQGCRVRYEVGGRAGGWLITALA
jgi:hypothetical protein